MVKNHENCDIFLETHGNSQPYDGLITRRDKLTNPLNSLCITVHVYFFEPSEDGSI